MAAATACSSDDGAPAGSSGGAAGSAGSAASGGSSGSSAGVGGIGALGGTAGSVSGGAAGSAGSSGSAGSDAGGGAAGGGAGGGAAGSAGSMDAGADADAGDGGCGPGDKVCGGSCVQVDDPDFGCGLTDCTPCAFANGTARCSNGQCRLAGCNSGFSDCNLNEADGCEQPTGTDANNCGACGNVCVINHGTPKCENSACVVDTCDTGWSDCDGLGSNGCEAFTERDPSNCGMCGNECQPAGSMCENNTCRPVVCLPGLADCDQDGACETNVGAFDANNCGHCGKVCSLPNAVTKCNIGKCEIESCVAPFLDCDGDPGNGCEVDPGKDNALHCGGCGRTCSTSNAISATCIGGACGALCEQGFDDCQTPAAPDADDGCERDVSDDPSNCGSCGNVCALDNAVAGCTAGECIVSSCTGTFGDCDTVATNGCETDTQTSVAHCGACGRGCSMDGVAVASCTVGLCTSACVDGRGNCSTIAAPTPDDGCESDVSADPDNCGGCGRACSSDGVASRECVGSVCTSSCLVGFGNCTMPVQPLSDNGCEATTGNDDQNCGGCGNDCTQLSSGSGLKCQNSQCGCAGNDGRCRQSGGDGVCNASNICVCDGSTCQPGEACKPDGGGNVCTCAGGAACTAGQQCCTAPAGCVDVMTDATSCGACGRACSPGFICSSGQCACTGDADCDAGGGGTCSAGTCMCSSGACAEGQRCLPGGICG